jgi:rSAM/selenodomain-associated transferase 1
MSSLYRKDRCILVFLRVPEKGKVKTRLSMALDKEFVLNIYKNFVLDVIETLKKRRYPTRICYYPADGKDEVAEWLGRSHVYSPQRGNDLGERMANSFLKAFSDGYKQVILIGTDVPDLQGAILDEAFESLQKKSVVIGPAFDGGYYLIGFHSNTFMPNVFQRIPWGSEHVFDKTIRILRKYRFSAHVLPKARDIDVYEDLVDFMKKEFENKSVALNTIRYLKSIGFEFLQAES